MKPLSQPARAERPAHVPEALVGDVDFFDLPGMDDDAQLAWLRLKDQYPPVFWTPHNGGHWIATHGADIRQIQTDHKRFSHRQLLLPPAPTPMRLIPITLDPPEHTPYRRIIMQLFAPSELNRLETRARDIAIKLVEEIAPKGECSFVTEFSDRLPIFVFLEMMGLPLEDRHFLMPLAEATAHGKSLEARAQANVQMNDYVEKWLDKRLAEEGGEDAISRIGRADIMQRKIQRDEAVSLIRLLLGGGLDTVANMMSYSIYFLARHPEHRQQLLDDPSLIPHAVEELIRRHGLTSTCREVTHDFEFNGAFLKKGDLIQQVNCLVGLDEEIVDDPLTVDFRRQRPIQHGAFGAGPHVCPGSMLARREIKVCLEEWLRRIPHFTVKPGTRPHQSTAMIISISDLQLSWPID